MSRMRVTPGSQSAIALAAIVLALVACTAHGQGTIYTSPQAPEIGMPQPTGVQRGSEMELLLPGSNLAGPTKLTIGCRANLSIPTDKKNGTENNRLRISLQVPADAAIGFHPIRVATKKGISNLRLFCVDDLPQVIESGKNRSKSTAQVLPLPCVAAGRVDAQQSAYFKIRVGANQRLSFDLLGRRLGSPFDPQLSIYDSEGREVAFAHDTPGCQMDPRLTHTFKHGGDYFIQIKDVLNRGGADYAFRLRIGDFPCATVPVPMVAKRGSSVLVDFAGPMVDGVKKATIKLPDSGSGDLVWVAPRGKNGLHGWPVVLKVSDVDQYVEKEPNNSAEKAQKTPLPSGMTGRFEQDNDIDFYRFAAKKGQRVIIRAQTLELYSPTLVYMLLRGAKSKKVIGKTNPKADPPADQKIEATIPADGDYLLEVQHLNFTGGPDQLYHVGLETSSPDFELSIPTDRVEISPGGFAAIPVSVTRNGYNGEISISGQGAEGIEVSGTIAAGQKTGAVVLSSKPGLPLGAALLSIVGKASVDGKVLRRTADCQSAVSKGLADLPYPPKNLSGQIAVGVRDKAPFSVTAQLTPPEIYPGQATTLKLKVDRSGFPGTINFEPLVGVPANVKAPKKIAALKKGKSEASVRLTVPNNAPIGSFDIVANAKGKDKKLEFRTFSGPFQLKIVRPVSVKLATKMLKLRRDGKIQVGVRVIRRAGYKGAVRLELNKAPAGITAAKVTLAAGKDAADLTIQASEKAAVGNVDVRITAVATAAGNQQSTSPPLRLQIEKK